MLAPPNARRANSNARKNWPSKRYSPPELAARTAAEAAERAAREKREIADREVALNAERKAERDAKYAARKARKR